MDLGVVTKKSPVAIFFQSDSLSKFNAFNIICKNYLTEFNNGQVVPGEKFVTGNIMVYNVADNIFKFLGAIEDPDILTVEFEETVESVKRRTNRELIFCGRRLEG